MPSASLGALRITSCQSIFPAGGAIVVIGVATWPGQTPLIRTPAAAYSSASDLIIPTTACFEAE